MITIVFWVLFALYLPIVGAWLYGLIEMRRVGVDPQMRLSPLAQWPADTPAPRVDIIVAAHNEEDSIEACLRALLAETYPAFRIIVANDRSHDDTAAIVHRIAREDPRVVLINVTDLPEGWIGKTHALSVAVRDADADYLLFIDSDVRLCHGALNAVMRKVRTDHIDFLSLWPCLELLSPAERLLTPPVGWLLSFWALLATGLHANSSEIRLGNGQFMLLSRSAYDRIGGHASVQAELAEDAIMAYRAADLGMRRWAGLGHGLYVTARTGSLGRTVNALTRVIIGSLVHPWRVLASTQVVLGGCVMALWVPIVGATWGFAWHSTVAWCFTAAALVHLVAMLFVLRGLFALTLAKRGSVLWFPFGCIIVAGIIFWSWLVMTGRGRVRWGATRYAVRGSRILHAIPDGG